MIESVRRVPEMGFISQLSGSTLTLPGRFAPATSNRPVGTDHPGSPDRAIVVTAPLMQSGHDFLYSSEMGIIER